ncbi:hypothetical protein L249_2371 [Ophiocordyceps polyrhachis-furcata BCC 54312]|uniref:Up-regulated during septation protein 1 domain-containing protein n=1 Tax=Ophiocordyceps polyrhachis-furcata BCC 54312 TaxID=1330021 RepID=A0A367LP43_9HYPO|nr:hypothetical protein L249_2371 [Ophiocordyceps polyrhachis-furcata BCC 54312]
MTFTNAPVTRLAVVGLVSCSIMASVFDMKHKLYIIIDSHLWRDQELWRLLTYQLCYVNSTEVLFSAMSVYNLRVVERMWGSRKYASFIVVSYLLTALVGPLIMVVLRPLSAGLFNYMPAGPTPVIFALLAQYYAIIPHTYKYRVAASPAADDAASGLTLSDKSYQYLIAFHLSVLQWPGSLVGAVVGWLVGHAWRGAVLPASLVTWRLPGWMVGLKVQGRSSQFEGLRRRLEGENRASAVSTAIQNQAGGSSSSRVKDTLADMNGFASGRPPFDYGPPVRMPSTSSPNGRSTANGFRRDNANGFGKPASRFNSTGSNQERRLARVDLKDAIQVHLLTETALSDSKKFEILSQEEVDDLKKQSQVLAQRVESTRANLAVQSKYRDAAVSMARLYGTAQPDDPNALEAERERVACERQCELLAAELFNLEKRLMGPQRRLLEHTAGILQLTHKASKKRRPPPPIGQLINGIPGSPESLYTYSLSGSSLDQVDDDNEFDDPSLYPLDYDGARVANGRSKKNAIEIPVKSPIREHNQLRGEMDRVREENMQLRGQTDMVIQKLESLNGFLRETIVRFNPEVNGGYVQPPKPTSTQNPQPAELLKSQVEYLERGLVAVQAEQESFVAGKDMGQRIESVNLQLRDLLMSADAHYTPTPIPPESDVRGQLSYLEASIQLVDGHMGRGASKGLDAETGPVLTRLWESIQKGALEARQRKEEGRRARSEKGVPADDDDDDMSQDEGFDPTEPYSLPAFASRVQFLHARASTLKDQKSVLKRQIKQQRELNSKSDAEKDQEVVRKQKELDQTGERLAKVEKEALDAQKLLSQALEDLEGARSSAKASESGEVQERDAKIGLLEAQLKETRERAAAAESEGGGAGQKLADMEARIASLTEEKAATDDKIQTLSKELEEKTARLADKEQKLEVKEVELEQLNMTLAELKTEVTIARAELDGAYGSRAERAADVAALKSSAEVVKLQNQVEKLKQELGETVKELEGITKETIGAEREKVELEVKLDEALSSKTGLETEMQRFRDKVAKLEEELDAERLKASSSPASGGRPGAGASMLSEQFRATMREERKRFQEDLKEERAKCRKLEDELNRLKRGQGQGLSPR